MIPCKITLRGDKNYARNFIGAGQSQLRILENQMSFQNLKQGVRRVRLNPRTFVMVLICFNLKEVIIYCKPIPRKMAGKEEGFLSDRFYTLLADGSFKWIIIKGNQTEGYITTISSEIEDAKIGKGNPYCTMIDYPYFGSRNVKSFMLNNERYVAALHSLAKDREIIYDPLAPSGEQGGFPPYCRDDFLECREPPETWSSRCNNATNLYMPYPPNRFLLNNDLMTWYHAREGFIFGVTIKFIGENKFKRINNFVKTWYMFDAYDEKTKLDGTGLLPIKVPYNPNMPIGMVPELLLTTEEQFEYNLDYEYWGGSDITRYYPMRRPIKITEYFDGTEIEVEAATTTEHWRWHDEGFILENFFTLEEKYEDFKILEEGFGENTADWPDCFGYGTNYEACRADNSHARVVHDSFTYWKKQYYDETIGIHINFFDQTSTCSRILRWIADFDNVACTSYGCGWAEFSGCYGPSGEELGSYTAYSKRTENFGANSMTARWDSANVAKVLLKGTIIEANSENLLQGHNDLLTADWPWEGTDLDQCCGSGKCHESTYYGDRDCENPPYPIPGIISDKGLSETKQWLGEGSAEWRKERNIPKEETVINESMWFFDGKKKFESTSIEKYWYLDDLSTEGSQGLLLAVKKNDGTFKFYHRFYGEMVFKDITMDVFESLGLIRRGVPAYNEIEEVGLI